MSKMDLLTHQLDACTPGALGNAICQRAKDRAVPGYGEYAYKSVRTVPSMGRA